jgi:hypothetical protein
VATRHYESSTCTHPACGTRTATSTIKMTPASVIALQLPSIASLACHTLAIVLLPLLVLALALIAHERRACTLRIEVRRAGDPRWRAEVVRSITDQEPHNDHRS